jgi:hypothetical protein
MDSEAPLRKPPRPLTPHSQALDGRRPMDGFIDPDSPEGRFIAEIEAGLFGQLGRAPTFSEQLIVRRASRTMLRLELFDKKLAGKWTDHDSRVYGGLQNALRLYLRELTLGGALSPPKLRRSGGVRSPSLADIAARHREKARAEAESEASS